MDYNRDWRGLPDDSERQQEVSRRMGKMKAIKKELQAIKKELQATRGENLELLEELKIDVLNLETSIKLMEMSQKPIVFQGSMREQSSESK